MVDLGSVIFGRRFVMAVQPVIKWVGGKRQLLPAIREKVPEGLVWSEATYFEPFVGGGAVLFDLMPDRAVVNDSNEELINLYHVVEHDTDALIGLLSTYPNDPEFYYEIRALDRDAEVFCSLSDVERPARMVYLNKTCFNGLYRVNKKGQFNASFGKYANPKICDEPALRSMSNYLNSADVEFRCGDYLDALDGAREGDFVYFDPPYAPLSVTSSFARYTSEGFDLDDQVRLRDVIDELTERGVFVLLSNSSSPVVFDLYSDYETDVVSATRRVNSKGSGRGAVDEVLIRNF